MLEATPCINKNTSANQLTHTRSKRTYDISGNAASRPESVPLGKRKKSVYVSQRCACMGDLHSLVTTKTTLGDNCNDNSTNTSIDNKNEAEVVEVIEANHKNCPIRRFVQNQKKA